MGLAQLIGQSFSNGNRLSPQAIRTAIPVRNPAVSVETSEDGLTVLRAPLDLTGRGLIVWMAKRTGTNPDKRFELEPVGAFVWEMCDGARTFEGISRKLQERYKMNRGEADAALSAFLQTLSRRRLITLMVKKKR